jgi:diaminopimelate decarboxylase
MRVIGKRSKNTRPCYHVNDGVYHSFNGILMDGMNFEGSDQFYASLAKQATPVHLDSKVSSIFGQTCDGADIIANEVMAPEMNVGDWITVGGMGAYSIGPASEFNGMTALGKVTVWRSEESQKVNNVDHTYQDTMVYKELK